MKGADPNSVSTVVTLMDKNEQVVVSDTGTAGNLVVNNPHLWWPRGMNDEVGYLYTFKVISVTFMQNCKRSNFFKIPYRSKCEIAPAR